MRVATFLRLAAVAAAVVLAGCASGNGPAAPTPAASADAPAQVEEFAGDAPPANPRREVPLAWDGKLGRGVCIPAPTGGCTFDPLHGDTHDSETIDPEGRVVSLKVVLRWTPGITTQNLWLNVSVLRGDALREVGSLAGPPPVVFETDDAGMQPGDKLVIAVKEIPPADLDAPFHAWMGQEFTVTGTLVVEDAPAT